MNLARDTDAAGFGETLEARRDVDTVGINLLALDHRVAEVGADTELYPALGNNTLVLCLHTVDNLAGCGRAAKSRLLFLSHEAAIAVHVSAEDCGELPFHYSP